MSSPAASIAAAPVFFGLHIGPRTLAQRLRMLNHPSGQGIRIRLPLGDGRAQRHCSAARYTLLRGFDAAVRGPICTDRMMSACASTVDADTIKSSEQPELPSPTIKGRKRRNKSAETKLGVRGKQQPCIVVAAMV
jgi:hypothetical protein